MAALSVADRYRICTALIRSPDLFGAIGNMIRPDLLAAVNAVDNWVDTNTASYVAALPEPFKARSTASQKSLLLVAVVLMRFNLDVLKSVFSRVD